MKDLSIIAPTLVLIATQIKFQPIDVPAKNHSLFFFRMAIQIGWVLVFASFQCSFCGFLLKVTFCLYFNLCLFSMWREVKAFIITEQLSFNQHTIGCPGLYLLQNKNSICPPVASLCLFFLLILDLLLLGFKFLNEQ